MALTHLLDTSVLTRLRHETIRETIEPLAEQGQLARAGISDLEIGYSARNAFALVETSEDHLRRARQVQRLLADRHQRGRKVPDLLIAAAAEHRNLAVLHYDADFDRIATVTGQTCEWVAPAGSVD